MDILVVPVLLLLLKTVGSLKEYGENIGCRMKTGRDEGRGRGPLVTRRKTVICNQT